MEYKNFCVLRENRRLRDALQLCVFLFFMLFSSVKCVGFRMLNNGFSFVGSSYTFARLGGDQCQIIGLNLYFQLN